MTHIHSSCHTRTRYLLVDHCSSPEEKKLNKNEISEKSGKSSLSYRNSISYVFRLNSNRVAVFRIEQDFEAAEAFPSRSNCPLETSTYLLQSKINLFDSY